MPALRESAALGILALVVLWLCVPEWAGGFIFGFVTVLGMRSAFTWVARLWPQGMGLIALGKNLALAGLAIGGIFLGLNPVGVALGLFLWPVSLWIWAVRYVRHSR
ncbi:MAG: hypothetical protein NZ651_00555 [Candidatus Bipolaricaulota bacterium]|nr:hypothetical protein [Candidatus Bipolaricaulota bacterium]MDW8126263.1 hypothetical protein [Candidatus Bipolaricaulota bacterium]